MYQRMQFYSALPIRVVLLLLHLLFLITWKFHWTSRALWNTVTTLRSTFIRRVFFPEYYSTCPSLQQNENDETSACSHFNNQLVGEEEGLSTVLGENFLFSVGKIRKMCRCLTLDHLNQVVFFKCSLRFYRM